MRAWISACAATAPCTCSKPTRIPTFPWPKISRSPRSPLGCVTAMCSTGFCSWAPPIRPPGAASSLDRWLLPGPLIKPPDGRVVPLDGVGRLQHPVILVREVQEFAGNAAPLQGGVDAKPLLVGNAVVELAVNHERGRLPAVDIVDRIVLRVAGGIHVLGTAAFPLGKP